MTINPDWYILPKNELQLFLSFGYCCMSLIMYSHSNVCRAFHWLLLPRQIKLFTLCVWFWFHQIFPPGMFTPECTLLHKSVDRVNCFEWSCPGAVMLFRPSVFTQKKTCHPWSLMCSYLDIIHIRLSLMWDPMSVEIKKPYTNYFKYFYWK